jgi:hypothetical protein
MLFMKPPLYWFPSPTKITHKKRKKKKKPKTQTDLTYVVKKILNIEMSASTGQQVENSHNIIKWHSCQEKKDSSVLQNISM